VLSLLTQHDRQSVWIRGLLVDLSGASGGPAYQFLSFTMAARLIIEHETIEEHA
jgi:hypothetical protein